MAGLITLTAHAGRRIAVRSGVSRDIIRVLLDPLGGAQFPQIYSEYSAIIDFFVYLALFIGVARVTLGKHFEGATGRLLINALGFILALALAVTGSRMNFTIASLGPYAAAVLLGFLGIILYRALIALETSKPVAMSISYLVIYSSMRGFSPGMFDWLSENLPIVAAFLSLALVFSVCTIIYAFMPKSWPAIKAQTNDYSPATKEQNVQAAQTSAGAVKVSEQIAGNERGAFERLMLIKKHCVELMKTREGRQALLKALKQINDQDHAIQEKLKDLKELDRSIANGDMQALRKSIADLSIAPRSQAKSVAKAVQELRERTNCEKTISQIAAKTEEILKQKALAIGACARAVMQDDAQTAARAVGQALSAEREACNLLKIANQLEQRLHKAILRAVQSQTAGKKEKAA